MSTSTSNLSLFKYNTSSDGSLTFSITSALNNNWDKIDSFAGNVNTVFNSTTVSGTGKNIFNAINTELGKKLEAEVSLSENGYIKFNSSKIGCSKTLIIQWFGAQKGATAWITHTFPTSFSSTNYYVSMNPYEASGKGANNSDSVTYRGVYSTWIKADTKITTGFCSSGIHSKDIIAIGF